MRMKHIEVPDFVADEFERPLTHPSPKADAGCAQTPSATLFRSKSLMVTATYEH